MASSIETTSTTTTLKNNGNTYLSVDTNDDVAITNTLTATSPTFVTPALGTPASGTLTNCSFPTLNQSTTGSAATLTTARTIGGVSFNGSANINLAGVNTAGNQNTSGTAAGLSATLAVGSGGTGVTSSTGSGNAVLSVSPTLTGTPLATTATNGTNTTQIATTAFAYGTVSKASSGYTKLANGLIIQWGSASVGANAGASITLPIAMPTAGFQVIASSSMAVRGDLWAYIQGGYFSSTSVIVITNGYDTTMSASWLAIGH